jgi:hypothetical protein
MKKNLLSVFVLSSAMVSAQDITSNLEAYFPFDNGQVTATSGAVTGVMHMVQNFGTAATTDRFGNPNSAMLFDGSTSYINFGDLPNYRFGMESFTVALWIEGRSLQAGQGIPVGKRGFDGGSDKAYMFGWKADGELMTYYRDDNGSGSVWPTNNVPAGSWHHIAMVFSRGAVLPEEDSLRVYVNAVKVSAISIDGLDGFNATGATMGGELMAGRSSQGGQHFNGKIDELYVFRRALTDADIQLLYGGSSSTPQNQADEFYLAVYPNPAQDVVNVELTSPQHIEIYALDGQLIDRFSAKQNHIIDVSNYSAGVYIVKSGEHTNKFIKN